MGIVGTDMGIGFAMQTSMRMGRTKIAATTGNKTETGALIWVGIETELHLMKIRERQRRQ